MGAAEITGFETPEDLIGLAEDALLYGGASPSSVRLILAPAGQSPDRLINAFGRFREEVPAHPATDGALAMQRAFLAAAGVGHAWGEGFLLSRGPAEVLAPGQIRWTEVKSQAEARAILDLLGQRLSVTSVPSAQDFDAWPNAAAMGDVHRPPLTGGPVLAGLGRWLDSELGG